MKQLDTTFEFNADKTGTMTFRQIRKENTEKGNLYIYERVKSDGNVFTYEVIRPKVLLAGTEVFGTICDTDQERYPGSAAWGRYGWDFPTLELAEKKFENVKNLLNGEVSDTPSTPRVSTGNPRGRQKVERPELVFPTKSQWTIKDLVKLNKEYTPVLANAHIKSLIGKSVVIVGQLKGKRGKPANVYSNIA